MKCCVLIVWFNPNTIVVNNVFPYLQIFDRIFIVDNSSGSNIHKIIENKKICYIPLYENQGIAKALNVGCEKAKDEGFDWILTMDQDSSWGEGALKNYVSFCEQIINEYDDVKSIAAIPTTLHSIAYDIIAKIKSISGRYLKQDYIFCDRCICSGNFIELKCWEQLEGFYEPLFIDDVDFEYCYRLRDAGYRIVQSNVHCFLHTIGSGRKSVLPGIDKHGSFRLYYIIRNKLFVIRKYPRYAAEYHYRFYLLIIIWQKIFCRNMIENFAIIKKAFKESKTFMNTVKAE